MRSPFKFLDSFDIHDREYFFGRDQETEALYEMVFQTQLLLVYGYSGTGKTSLVQCGLASRFDGTDWYPFFIQRQGNNIVDQLHRSLSKVLDGQRNDTIVASIKSVNQRYLRPVYLIFDQFEELFTLGTPEEEAQLLSVVEKILSAGIPCKIIFVLREEFVGSLYPFEKTFSELSYFRLRVEHMRSAKIRNVISASLDKFNISVEPPTEESLDVIMDMISSDKTAIQLPYLQVYLETLYNEDYKRTYGNQERGDQLPPLQFTRNEIRKLGKLEKALKQFLELQEDELRTILATEFTIKDFDLVRRIMDTLVTDAGTKSPVKYAKDPKTSKVKIDSAFLAKFPGIAEEVLTRSLAFLEVRRLLRISDEYYELAHDSLAALIDGRRTPQERKLNEIRDTVERLHGDLSKTNDPFTRSQIDSYQPYIEDLNLRSEVKNYFEESVTAIEAQEQREKERTQKVNRLLRIILTLVSIVAVGAIAMGFFIWESNNQERKQNFNLLKQSATALKESGKYKIGRAELEKIISEESFRDYKVEVDSLISNWNQIESLVNSGDSLFEEFIIEDTATYKLLPLSLNYFNNAKALSSGEDFINDKIIDVHQTIKETVSERKNLAQEMIDLENNFTGATQELNIALILNPPDSSSIKELIRNYEIIIGQSEQ